MKHKTRTYRFMFAAYLKGVFVELTEARNLSEAKRLFKYHGVLFDQVESV